ncbi:MAG TPA: MBL fold metallo-hydrolase [Nannocystis exedens]|nr:MBL fold metallo-hydrolase [Nannocystis exedens]
MTDCYDPRRLLCRVAGLVTAHASGRGSFGGFCRSFYRFGRAVALAMALIPVLALFYGQSGCASPVQVAAPAFPAADTAGSSCGARYPQGIALQILGSGGPIADDRRASSGYLVWVQGRARVLVDIGGGVVLNFAASGAAVEDLQVVVLSHLHVDHSVDFAALMKSAYFGERSEPLPVFGPDGNEYFPGLAQYLSALFGERGAYRYLGWTLQEGEGPFSLEVHEVAVAGAGEQLILDDLRLSLVGAPHGVVPALGVRVDVGGRSIAFAGDQRLDDARFLERIAGVDVLVAHDAIPERSGGPARSLHAPPSAIGRAAAAAKVGRLILSHHMIRALRGSTETIAEIRAHYRGPLLFADDLTCVPLD